MIALGRSRSSITSRYSYCSAPEFLLVLYSSCRPAADQIRDGTGSRRYEYLYEYNTIVHKRKVHPNDTLTLRVVQRYQAYSG